MALSQAILDSIKAANERQAAEEVDIRARMAAAGGLLTCIRLGYTTYYLLGVNKAGDGLYEHRNWRMGGRSYATVSPLGRINRSLATKPLGFRKRKGD